MPDLTIMESWLQVASLRIVVPCNIFGTWSKAPSVALKASTPSLNPHISSLITFLPHTTNSNHTSYLPFPEHIKTLSFLAQAALSSRNTFPPPLHPQTSTRFEAFLKHMASTDLHPLPPAKVNCSLLWALLQHGPTCTVISQSLSVIN